MSQSTPTDHEIDVYASEFVLTGDKSKSWKKTFPKSKAAPPATSVMANRFHKIDKVLIRIEQKRIEIAQNDAENFSFSYEAQLERCKAIYQAGLKSKFDPAGNEIPVNLTASQSAINEINKMAGHHAAVKSELSGKDGAPLQIVINDKDAKL